MKVVGASETRATAVRASETGTTAVARTTAGFSFVRSKMSMERADIHPVFVLLEAEVNEEREGLALASQTHA